MKKLSFGFLFVIFITFLGCKIDSKPKLVETADTVDNTDLLTTGKEISSATFLALSSELQKAMKSGGVDHALSYCNLNAIEITDSLSNKYNVDIKRTSLKFRNPLNKPSQMEEKILLQLENEKKSGKEMLPQVISDGNSETFFAPIIVQDMCLKCHGQKENIENYSKVKDLYPNDLAIGYEGGDLRGIWSIRFK